MIIYFFFFFFQAEDGIRDVAVTGVQTCALPIWPLTCSSSKSWIFSGNCSRTPRETAILSARDRKSTRLNSSHGYISYAVFCLKKKLIVEKFLPLTNNAEITVVE